LVAGLAAAVVVRPADDTTSLGAGTTITVSPNEPAPTLPGIDGEVAGAIPAIMKFVEGARGLTYKHPVKVTLLADEAFKRRLRGTGDKPDAKEVERIRTNEKVLRALGLLEKGVDLQKATDSLLDSAVAGFYDTEHDDLVVRGSNLTPFVRTTFAHELTHALQDQYFDLDRTELNKRDDEAAQAFTSLVEGDAVRVEEIYTDGLSDEDQKRAQLEEMGAASGIDISTPRVLLQLLVFPYAAGPTFVKAVVANAGRERLDRAFVEPPTTTEQIMHPDRFLKGEGPAAVESPKAPEKEIDKGVLGEFGLLLVLSETLEASQVQVAASGWGGDRYVAWSVPSQDRTCVRTNLTMDTAQDTTELRSALDAAAKKRSGLTIAPAAAGRGNAVTFTSCG
jgi:hypothetical protein